MLFRQFCTLLCLLLVNRNSPHLRCHCYISFSFSPRGYSFLTYTRHLLNSIISLSEYLHSKDLAFDLADKKWCRLGCRLEWPQQTMCGFPRKVDDVFVVRGNLACLTCYEDVTRRKSRVSDISTRMWRRYYEDAIRKLLPWKLELQGAFTLHELDWTRPTPEHSPVRFSLVGDGMWTLRPSRCFYTQRWTPSASNK